MDFDTLLDVLELQLLIIKLHVLRLSLICLKDVMSRRRTHRWWIRPICRRRKHEGMFHTVMPQLLSSRDTDYFVKYFRMSSEIFHKLCESFSPKLQKFPRNREPISPEERTSIALRFLSSGTSINSIAVAPGRQIWETCEGGFNRQWQFPSCIGALDGKHILLQCPGNSGSKFYNYKGAFSLVLMAVVDATYKFVYVDIGAYGSQSDGGVFKACSLGEHLCNGTLDIPNYTLNSNEQVPVCLVADSAFQLHRHLMKPYPSRGLNHSRRIFNYRLSRARRCVENAFGILASRWRVFLRPLGQAPSTVEKIVKAAIVLHNMLGTTSEYAPAGYGNTLDVCGNIVEGEWRSNIESVALSALQPLPLSSHVRQHTEDAKEIRDKYRKYFVSSQGEVP